MTRIIKRRQLQWILVFILMIFPANILTATAIDSFDPIQEITKSFPNSVKVKQDGKKSVEFCPDNTCDFFTASKEMSAEELKDFVYLYLYFFSDYYVLDEWRHRDRPALIVRQILLKASYQGCKKNIEEEAARCLLRRLSRKSRIKLYAVRYDENVRSLVRKDISKAIAVTQFKKQE